MKLLKISAEYIINLIVAIAQALLPFLRKEKDNIKLTKFKK